MLFGIAASSVAVLDVGICNTWQIAFIGLAIFINADTSAISKLLDLRSMNRYHSAEANLVAHIKTLRLVGAGLFAVCLLLLAAVFWIAREHRLSLPPELRFGSKLTTGTIEPHEVYLFAGSVYQQIYLWLEDGNKDFTSNIQRLRYLMTDDFHRFLIQKNNDLAKRRELKGRRRNLQPAGIYKHSLVRQTARNAWLVQLDLILNESLNGIKIKDGITIREHIPVVYKDVNSAYNPWGLLLDTPAKPLIRIPASDTEQTQRAEGGKR